MNIDEVVFSWTFFEYLVQTLSHDRKEKNISLFLKRKDAASFVAINYTRGAICLLAPDRLMPRSV